MNIASKPMWLRMFYFLAVLVCSASCIIASLADISFTPTATAKIVNGFVVEIVVTQGGHGYSYPPAVTIIGGGGQGAEAMATITDGSVTGIRVTDAGVGYTSPPEVAIAPPLLPLLDVATYAGVTIQGAIGRTYSLYFTSAVASTSSWQKLDAIVLTKAVQVWIDLDSPKAGQRFYKVIETSSTNEPPNPDPVHLVWLPPGSFVMGSAPTSQDRGPFDGPQTSVTLTKGFWMSRYEVTQGDYKQLMKTNPSYFTGNANRPVETVSWSEATNYCGKLTAQERQGGRLPAGYEYRLPAEAQWEYACRAGTQTRFSFGDDPKYTEVSDFAWSGINSGFATHGVSTKLPNLLGLHDMHGNVSEWCLDKFSAELPGGAVRNPVGPTSGVGRVVRGGNWNYDPHVLQSAYREQRGEGSPIAMIGFRIALVPTE